MIHDEESQPLHPSTPLRIPRHIVANSVIVEEAVDWANGADNDILIP